MDTLSFGSFPRSANHFCFELIQKTLPDIKFVYLEHRIHPLDKEDNVFTTLRTPIECIPSWITFMSDERPNRAEQVLEWYCAYYQKCKESNVLIIPFTQLISEPLACVKHICDIYSINKPIVDMVEFDFSTGFHVPTKDKKNFESIIEEMKVAPSFNRAMELFETLCVSVL